MRRFTVAGWILALAGLLTLPGCIGAGDLFPPVSPPEPPGRVRVVIHLPQVRAAALGAAEVPAVARIVVTFRKDAEVVTGEIRGGSGPAQGEFTLWPGRWRVSAEALDAGGVSRYSGETTVDVMPQATARVELTLTAQPATLAVQLDLAGFDRADDVKMALIRLEPSPFGASNYRKFYPGEGAGSFGTEFSLPPRTYDYRIELYSESSAYSRNLLYAFPWERIDLDPGERASLRWSPVSGAAEVVGRLDPPPAAPTLQRVEASGSELTVVWQAAAPADEDLAGYRVYLRKDPFAGFTLVGEAPAGADRFTGVLDLPSGTVFWVAVTAFDAAGQESLRSNELSAQVP